MKASWISSTTVDQQRREFAINDKESLEAWLRGQSREVAIAIATRAALRVAPLAVRLLRNDQSVEGFKGVVTLASIIFRSCALARLAARYPVRATEIREIAYIAASREDETATSGEAVSVPGAASAASSAASADHAAFAVAAGTSTAHAGVSVTNAIAAASNADARDPEANVRAMWEEIRVDVASIQEFGVNTSSDAPLWSKGAPEWATVAWESLRQALPEDQSWEVWTKWYEERLRGVSRGEAYELVFASVPQEEWDKGPATANAWIKAHLSPSMDDNLKERDGLKQQAALYTFRLADDRIAVAPEDARPEDQEATRDFLDELRRKAAVLRERLVRVQADVRLQRTLALLDERLSLPIEAIRVGLVLSSLRSLEFDVRAYDTEEGRKEHAIDLIAALDDLAGTVRDLASQFPRTREILANQIALKLAEEPRALDAAIQASESLAIAAASNPELVDRDAPEALREPKELAEGARTTADYAKHVGLRLLTAANFSRIVAQVRETAVQSWDEMLKQVPKAAGKAAANVVMAGPGLAFGLWAGHNGLMLLLDTAGAIAAINGAVGHPGGAFDRLLKTIERVAAKKPVAEPPKAGSQQPRRPREGNQKPNPLRSFLIVAAADSDGDECAVGNVPARAGHAGRAGRMA